VKNKNEPHYIEKIILKGLVYQCFATMVKNHILSTIAIQCNLKVLSGNVFQKGGKRYGVNWKETSANYKAEEKRRC
jgi:hypothetical protein